MTERHYSDAEVSEIFRLASELENGPRAVVPTDGMTLGQLQEIGLEAGLSAELIARAAQAHMALGNASTRKLAGLPIGVGHTIELDRSMPDSEWERLVSELRETFQANGVITYSGPFRQWRNGNLQVSVEPHERGHRVRFRTVNASYQMMIGSGLAMVGGSAALAALTMLFEPFGPGGMLQEYTSIAAAGAVLTTIGAVRVRAWARERRAQMDSLVRRIVLRRSSHADVVEAPTLDAG